MEAADKTQENKAIEKQTETSAKKTGVIRAEVSGRPLLKGHVKHLINAG